MMLRDSTYVDEWIEAHYPDAMFYVDESGEIYVGLGIDLGGNPVT